MIVLAVIVAYILFGVWSFRACTRMYGKYLMREGIWLDGFDTDDIVLLVWSCGVLWPIGLPVMLAHVRQAKATSRYQGGSPLGDRVWKWVSE